jgi:hypothetical protein
MRKLSSAKIEELSGYKTCKMCQQIKPLDMFRKFKEGVKRDHEVHYTCYCKSCVNTKGLEYYYSLREQKKEYQREYARRNRLKWKEQTSYSNRSALYDRRVRKAKPPWLSLEQRRRILAWYKQCNKLNNEGEIKYNVDHIIPINSRYVCGLHVDWNLQILPAEENNRKNNSICNDTLSKLYIGYSNFEITKDLLRMVEQSLKPST